MRKFIRRRVTKVGLPPGTLIPLEEKRAEKVKVTLIDYNEATIQERKVERIEECFPFKDKPTVTWINIDGIHNPEIIEKIGNYFSLHPLTLEDIMDTEHRPKIEVFEDYIFIVLKMLYHDEKEDEIKTEQISLIVGQNFVISFQEREGDLFNPIRERIRTGRGRIRKMGTDYLAYALMDTIVDNYFIIPEKLGEKVELIEKELLDNPKPQTLKVIQNSKRELIFLQKSIWPLREVLSRMERLESSLIHESTLIYLRDIYDHTIQIIDTIETSRNMLSGMLDIYISSISNKMNQVMKVLTIIATIFIPLTFVAGIYGMNFKYMVELEWKWGYPIVLLTMLGIGISMVIYFKNKRWL